MLKKAAFFVLSSLPVFFFFWYLWRFSTPFPNEDDIPAILAFINRAFPFTDESWRLLFVPFREHVILPAKVIAYSQVLFTGSMNLKAMILLGNLFWVRVLWLLYSSTKEAKLPSFLFLPVPFILFQAQFSETALWPMALWSNLIVVWLGIESLNLLISTQKDFWRFGLAFLLAFSATFSNGNGLLVLIIGFTVLLFQRAEKSRILIWLSLSAVSITCYWWAKSLGVPDHQYGVQANPLKWLAGCMIFIGNYGDFVAGSLRNLALALGFVLTTILFAINFLQIRNAGYFTSFYFKLAAAFLFILMTGAAVALLRTEPVGLEAMYLGRYRHYSALAVSIVYITFVSYVYPRHQANWMFYVTLPMSILVSILSYYKDWGYRYMDNQRFFTDAYNMKYNNTLYVEKKDQMAFPQIFRETLDKHLLTAEQTQLVKQPSDWLTPPADSPAISTTIQTDTSTDTSGCSTVYNVKSEEPVFQLQEEEMWVWMLKNNEHSYLYPSTSIKTKPSQLVRNFAYFKPGFVGEIAVCRLPKGIYSLFLVHIFKNHSIRFYKTNRTIVI
ncbi:hypothetical protein [Runella slithyformis]|uniref:Glycosyltransferase RgtA/B/C/D-like domain-containing protein n=1 Tax=Runella slithyformis (strain ATCC 29530 / DSM 19594 / LMG 11500 / NCIMB 11436 / LSU 4) TaxID=761193 RepID=A0A7U3ZK60_RUNSL|nr:hypothetical protein [Runella slithyformis]AEI48737.1 hypothetical protein Runsl_2326 [Runella slithyformis DSM 19594]